MKEMGFARGEVGGLEKFLFPYIENHLVEKFCVQTMMIQEFSFKKSLKQ